MGNINAGIYVFWLHSWMSTHHPLVTAGWLLMIPSILPLCLWARPLTSITESSVLCLSLQLLCLFRGSRKKRGIEVSACHTARRTTASTKWISSVRFCPSVWSHGATKIPWSWISAKHKRHHAHVHPSISRFLMTTWKHNGWREEANKPFVCETQITHRVTIHIVSC